MNTNMLAKSYLGSKIEFESLNEYYNSINSIVNISVKDYIEKYRSEIKSRKHFNSRTISFAKLLYDKTSTMAYSCILAQLKCILLKFGLLNNDLKNSVNAQELVEILPSDVKTLIVTLLSVPGNEVKIEDVIDSLSTLKYDTNYIYNDYECSLNQLILTAEQLNNILEMFFEPQRWYDKKSNLLDSDDVKIVKDIFNKYYKDIK